MALNHEQQWFAGSRRKAQPAGSWLLRQGEAQSKIHLLHHGVARAVYHANNGVERVKEFYFAGEYCFLYLNWLTKTPADYSLQMITAGETSEISLALLDAPENQDIKTQLLIQQLIYKEKKEQMLLLNTPEQRYRYVQTHFPDWESQLTQRDLANYIGINPVSLSRIRQRLNKS
ncbi:Crp/Fnr family transcriptional regulator [Citrobacter werkmanii]|uniref:Crp/Fnr family transcriptional regulator n=1 Tax=Citrobacter TaxID=544 RepID=UPI00076E93FA|nr:MULTISPECIES: Crp/Fnr family transcriptional regulator [Citrobacter]TKT96593.1 Crp/Fnr family transcriptional regulator [Citrobacter sp. wls830]GAS71964.1 cyclic nucleotide-binding domain protein [Salmonella enterica]MBW9353440.1 Crp/Fnr family transcriptional regulator [Citrobacter sp. EC_71]MDV7073439.1 Crp/Fnr family transcriptional regulator [Citrobacter werkmanii]TKU68593.1 Crp/Fnr family transcriptional regulator [Citrobacter sp. wls710]